MEFEFEFLFQPGLKFTFDLEFALDFELKSEFARIRVRLRAQVRVRVRGRARVGVRIRFFINSSPRVPVKRLRNYRDLQKNKRWTQISHQSGSKTTFPRPKCGLKTTLWEARMEHLWESPT